MTLTLKIKKKKKLLLEIECTVFMLFCTSDSKYYYQEGEQNMTMKTGIMIVGWYC